MFVDEALSEHLKHNHAIRLRSVVLAEFNMNQSDNVKVVGNYRYRPLLVEDSTALSTDALAVTMPVQPTIYAKLINVFDANDIEDFYTDATKSTVYINAGYNNDELVSMNSPNEKMEMYYDIEACVQPFRPRSGINTLFLNGNRRTFIDRIRSGERPRYYFASKDASFKYWNSYRTEGQDTFGLSMAAQTTAGYQIQDAVPFVVYEAAVPTNKLVVKLQTNVGSYQVSDNDPHYGAANATVPVRWKLQYLLENDIWETAYSFSESTVRSDGSTVFGWDGTVELKYGFVIPDAYKLNFNFVDYLTSTDLLPPLTASGYAGEAYAVISGTSAGTLYIRSTSNEWESYPVDYGFSIIESSDYGERSSLKTLSNPPFYMAGPTKRYREFVMLKGLRIVVETMNTPNTPFELIEMSPRLLADVTEYATQFNFNKTMLTGDHLPVGDLLASNGTVELTNFGLEFSQLNKFNGETGSIIASHLKPNVKFMFFEGVRGVGIYEKLVPIKWLYTEDFPKTTYATDVVSVNLRDMFFLLEGNKAPEVFFRNIPLTAAICILLDSIGFSNYRFVGFSGNDPVIPNFFVGPDQNVAEVLRNIAVATQSAMFFDEYNNLTVYSKEYVFDNRAKSLDLNVNARRSIQRWRMA
jgi:hypothetical protein